MHPIHLLRYVGLLEGASFVVLVGVGVPLKYALGMPQAVRVFGMTHGVLFLLSCGVLVWAAAAARWPMRRALLVFVAALLPTGPFWIDRRMRAWAGESDVRRAGAAS